MSIDSVPPTLGVQAVYPRQDKNGKPGREPPRDGKPGQPEQQQQDQDPLFLNSLGQVTGKTINITA
ncbi:MAG: hypothetical protein Q8L44_02735 [Sulfuritalea sp.]|nr:hypothetical protein [Sulfuritalea sp.]